MIKVTRTSVADSEVELIVMAARFFSDRLIPAAKQKKLSLNILVTAKPGRQQIAIKWLVGSNGLFRVKPPQNFEMTVSVAAGVKDGLEIVANEIIHVSQVISGRLKVCLKKRRINGQSEDAYAASWIGSKFSFIDMTRRSDRLWEIEAGILKTQLVDEFLSWSAGALVKLSTQQPKKNGYGLYSIRPKTVSAPVRIPPQSDLVAPAVYQLDHVVDLPPKNLASTISERSDAVERTISADSKDWPLDHGKPKKTPVLDVPVRETTASAQQTQKPLVTGNPTKKVGIQGLQTLKMSKQSDLEPDQQLLVNHLGTYTEDFKINVEVPRLGTERILNSVMLHGKLNDLTERGLIPHDTALAAYQQAQQNQKR